MARRRNRRPSRDRGQRLLWWLMLATIGGVGGIFLGEMAIGSRVAVWTDSAPSYARFSANPEAQMNAASTSNPCRDCPDSYGVAAQMRAAREERMSDPFRKLGAVDADMSPASEAGDEYHYGGRFPDPAPLAPEILTPADNLAPNTTAEPPSPEAPQQP